MRIETTPVVKTTETYVLQHFVKVSHTEELRSKGKQTEKAGKKRGTADDSKITNTRITRNKHQLQHQTTRQSEKKILPYDHSKNLIISQKFRTNCRPPTFTRRRPATTTKSIDENDEDFETTTTPTRYSQPH